MILSSVDLPDPFLPRIAMTSPLGKSTETSLSAVNLRDLSFLRNGDKRPVDRRRVDLVGLGEVLDADRVTQLRVS